MSRERNNENVSTLVAVESKKRVRHNPFKKGSKIREITKYIYECDNQTASHEILWEQFKGEFNNKSRMKETIKKAFEGHSKFKYSPSGCAISQ